MKKRLWMIKKDPDGKIVRTESIEVDTNKLSTFAAPGVSGADIYDLKKTGKLMFESHEGFFEYWLLDLNLAPILQG